MKKILILGCLIVFGAALALANNPGDEGGKATEATITKLDMASKSMVVKTTDGQEMTIYWDDKTQVQGTLKEGEIVHVKTTEKNGQTWATWVHVGPMEKKK